MPQSQKTLPACKRCHTNKIRCDGAAPHCSACQRTAQPCIFLCEEEGVEYSRQAIADLEAEEARLRSALESNLAPAPDEFVGEGSGSSFFETMISSPRWTSITSDLLQELRHKRPVPEPPGQKATLPSAIESKYYIETYLNTSHLHHPFCFRSDLLSMQHRIFATAGPSQATPQDYYRLFLICAVAAISLQRSGVQTASPPSFFLAAQDYEKQIPILGSMDAIQNLLLMARFGIYFHIGCSTWEIARLCMRQCIDMEYHLQPRLPVEPLREQHQRRVFWECYILDRYASSTLGRPFAIADTDIEVRLPLALSDNAIALQACARLDDVVEVPDATDTMSIFVWIIKLRRITSRIHSAFFAVGNHSLSRGLDIYARLYSLLDDLESWRRSGPVFTTAPSLYQNELWYDFLLQKERLSLIRGAMNNLPNPQLQPPSKTLTALCSEAAMKVIDLYKHMFDSHIINCTRGYFQMLFTAGVSLIYCWSSDVRATSAHDVGHALQNCAKVLEDLSQTLTDARPYSYAFQVVLKGFQTDCVHNNTESSQDLGMHDASQHAPSSGIGQASMDLPPLDAFSNDMWMFPDWPELTSRLFADMESDVNQYAVGNWMVPEDYDFDLESLISL